MNLALFGGSFDPIHLGHLAIAENAWREQHLDRVLFIPARQSPHKTQIPGADGKQRCAMVEIAIRELPWAELWTGELHRPSPSFSWQTVAYFRHAVPGARLFWILGSDQWESIESWARPDYLARALTFLVFSRGTAPTPKAGFQMIPLAATHPASSTAARLGQIEYLPPLVARYIRSHGIYRASAEATSPDSSSPHADGHLADPH